MRLTFVIWARRCAASSTSRILAFGRAGVTGLAVSDGGLTYDLGEYLQLGSSPDEREVVCVFRVATREDTSLEEAAAAMAAESSVGSWTPVGPAGQEAVRRLRARAFRIDGDLVHIAYPPELFEPGSLPQFLAALTGSVFGFTALPAVRLEDVRLPLPLVESFPGPHLGIAGVRRLLGVADRPLACATVRPKVGLSPREQAALVRETLLGGLDLVKDDEALTGQPSSPFDERVKHVAEAVREAERATGEPKGWCANITAGDAEEMVRRAEVVRAEGGKFVLVDFLTAGLAATATVRRHCQRLGLALFGHRAMHAVLDRPLRHGIDYRVIARWARLVGLDLVLVGAGAVRGEARREELRQRCRLLRDARVPAGDGLWYPQEWGRLKAVLPVASGALDPRHVWDLYEAMGKDAVFLFGGGCHGHPWGSRAGAEAIRAALEAAVAGIGPERAAASHPALAAALEYWSAYS